ncbi:protease inhibitor I42 family protein [Streptomyces sp. NBC_01304]|uniref:protease inhibitor I42 family protein n=1 Tax=Streptomyces sp. NBC_01304 TaxID=2903818 RepID=UPI002E133512|nr:protease inhibitor I42 family protein [Streptomyces sp. NBC_01304]
MRLRSALSLVLSLVALTALSGCGLFGPTTYGVDEQSIEVDAGDEFVLSLPASPSLGENWFVAEPRADKDVVKLQSLDEDWGDGGGNDGGGGGTQSFTFKAGEPGTAKIKMLHCQLGKCSTKLGAPAPTPSPGESPFPVVTGKPGEHDREYYVFTVTVG